MSIGRPLGRPARILLVEDHPADIALARKAFSRITTPSQLDVVLDGLDAMRYLRREGRHVGVQRPDLILLDLHMPRKDGREVLREIDGDPNLRPIPVIVLTTSASDDDVAAAYRLRANSYMTKPVTFDDFLRLVRVIEDYWFRTVVLPK